MDACAELVTHLCAAVRDEADASELCRRSDGIPLTIEPAAGLPRHRTLRTAVGRSHELCTPEERLLWAWLSVSAGRFDL